MSETAAAVGTSSFVERLGLSTVSPEAPGLLVRMFRVAKPGPAMQAVEARLATEPWSSLTREELEAELSRWNVRLRDVRDALFTLYRKAAEVAVRDDLLHGEESGALEQLASLLGVEAAAAEQMRLEAAETRYRGALSEAIADRWLTDEERSALDRMSERLHLPQARLEAIHHDLMGQAIQALFKEQTADRRFSPEEEAELHRVAKNLCVDLTLDDTAKGLIGRYRQLWEIDQGQLPSVDVPVRLQRGETCHWHGDGRLQEFRSVTTAIGYSGPTARIRLGRGLSWRIGRLAVNRVTQDVLREIDSGTLYVTSKRLIFNGYKKTTALPLRRILNFTVYQDGVQIEKDSGKDQFFMFDTLDSELLGAILDAAVEQGRGA